MIRKNMVFLWVTALLPLLLCLWFYPQLPELIPTNFNNGEITKYGPKATIWIIGGLGPVIALLFTLLPMVDPRRRNYDRLGSRYNLLAGGVNLFLLMMTGLIIAESLRPGSLRVENLVFAAIGLLFAMMGNFMPKAGSNFAFGIRNMWTLSSETVWKRTHRMAANSGLPGDWCCSCWGFPRWKKWPCTHRLWRSFWYWDWCPLPTPSCSGGRKIPTRTLIPRDSAPIRHRRCLSWLCRCFYWQIHRKAGDFFGLSTALWDGKMKTDRAARRLGNLL